MDTKRQKLSTVGMEWRLDDPNVQRGLSRLFKDLQAMMSEEQIQKVLLLSQGKKPLSGGHIAGRYPNIPVLPHPVVGGATIHKGRARRNADRHAA